MKASIKLISQMILILVLISYSFQKSTLYANYISNDYCDSELNRYSFQIECELRGNLSPSMFNAFTIVTNSYYEPEIKCEIPEISGSSEYNSQYISIPCYVNNFQNGGLSFRFDGESDELDLVNFNEMFLNLNIYCQQTITLKMGNIIDKECVKNNSKAKYTFKIKLLNEILPKDLNINYFYLQPTIIQKSQDSNNNIWTDCDLILADYNNHLKCTVDFNTELMATIYFEKDYSTETWRNNYHVVLKNENNDLYVGQDIVCYSEKDLNYLNIFRGSCKNGAFYFSLDLSTFGDNNNEQNSEIYSKSLFEFKTKVDSKIYKNYCYLDNRNEDDKYDLTKYKLNCAISSTETVKINFQNLFSQHFLFNRFAQYIINFIYCFASSSQKYITPFYYYYDICSNNNNFKILAVTSFNNNIFNSALNDTIEIPIISPFISKAICKISSLTLEAYIEFNCNINNYETIDYKQLIFGNVTTNAYYDNMNPIIFDGFEGNKNFGKYCSNKGSKCTQLIENDYGYNSKNINNPTVYENSFCITSDNNSIFDKDYYKFLFNDNSFGNCSLKNTGIVHDNTNETRVTCLFDEEILDKYPLINNFNKINFTSYNNIYKDFNRFIKFVKETLGFDFDLKLKINEDKNYYCMNNNTILLILSANFSRNNNSEVEKFFQDLKRDGLESFINYIFNDILDN